jgi:glucuronoarabinoxylan endo-1,4-beta-xylanase
MCFVASIVSAARVTVDLNTTAQTIDGMGGYGAMRPWWSGGPFYNSAWLSTVIDSIGMTMFRTEFYPLPEQADGWTKQVPYWKALKIKADASGEPLRVIATIWTPPARMKTTGDANTGELKQTSAVEYTDYIITYIKNFKTLTGFDLYALSPGNEVQVYHGWFNGCKWDPVFLGDFIVALSKRITEEQLPTKIYVGDDLYNHFTYAKSVDDRIYAQHAVTKNVVRASAMHYGPNGSDENVFRSYGALTSSRGRVAWNTEFGNGADTWGDAWGKAKDILMMLRNNYGAIVYWLIGPHTNSAQLEESVMANDRPGPKAYTAKSFFRFIRPGAVRVGAASDDNTVWTVAFKHVVNGTYTVILLNNGSATANVTVAGTGLPPRFDMYRTGEGNNCVKVGTATAGTNIQVPVRTIVTLYGSETVLTSPRNEKARKKLMVSKQVAHTLVGLDGRMVRDIRNAGMAAGIYFSVAIDDKGYKSMERVIGFTH